MAHVTFIHGISNQPAAKDLLKVWCRSLAEAAEPISLQDAGITTSMVYWADLMYTEPVASTAAIEGVSETSAGAIDGAGDAELPIPANAIEAQFLDALRARLTTLSDAEIQRADQALSTDGAQGALERVPLPWFIKRPMMQAFLRDVHHYLFDVEYAPRGRRPVPIQRTIRRRFAEALAAPAVSGPHIIVAHSMGTVIAYDCLKRVADCGRIDGLITIGSPLGLDEVQDQLQPGWSREDGFPGVAVTGKWFNLFDRLDPVCGFDAQLANDYRRSGREQIEDIPVQNDGVWRHSATKYLRQPRFTAALRQLLQL
jgi:hypothetical protein